MSPSTLSLHDALPISLAVDRRAVPAGEKAFGAEHPVFANQLVGLGIDLGRVGRHAEADAQLRDRKSTRLNSSHSSISYAVFCLKKKSIQVQLRAARSE